MNNSKQIFRISVILVAFLLFQCKNVEDVPSEYIHDQVFVEMMVDLTLMNKIHSKMLYSKRDLMVDTLLEQIETIHGRSMQQFDTYLRQVSANDEIYAEFLDSVNVSRQRLKSRLTEVQNDDPIDDPIDDSDNDTIDDSVDGPTPE